MKKTLKLVALTLVCILCLNLGAALAEVDFANYPETIDTWTTAEVMGYLKDCGLINEAYYTLDMSVNDLDAMKAKAGFIHLDMDGMQAYVIMMQIDTETEEGAAIMNGICENQVLAPDGDIENGIQIDAVIGNLCFYYTDSLNEEYVAAFTQALTDLCAHYGVEPVYMPE